jgi:hypothetical protein
MEEDENTHYFKGDGYEVKIGDDGVSLSSGANFYANIGIIGISPEGKVYEGYDGGVETENFTAAQRQELALFMIDQWKRFGRS